MEKEINNSLHHSYPMNKGNGPFSYSQNSSVQRGASEIAQDIIREEISKKLDIQQLSSSSGFLQSFHVADFGCSTGPNTFLAIQPIVEALGMKFQSTEGTNPPEFQVFFNDVVSNDFNHLFGSLPRERRYFAAGVPGSFYGRLFPKSSLHFAHSASSLSWLSRVPEEVTDKSSPAYNGEKIHYIGARKEVSEAYSAQCVRDVGTFLLARAQELAGGGLLALVSPGLTDKISISRTSPGLNFQVFESCLIEMAKKGLISEENVNSFNLPIYFPSLKELEAAVHENGQYFTTERIEILVNPMEASISKASLEQSSLHMRAVFEGMIIKYFGTDIANELFNEYSRKVAECPLFFDPDIQQLKVLVLVLKRKMDATLRKA